jgi:hypothetical protein
MSNIAKTEPNNRPKLQKGDNGKWVVVSNKKEKKSVVVMHKI